VSCLHSSSVTRASEEEALPLIMDFDPQKTYRQPVVLVSFNDRDFSMDNPKDYYHRLFNEQGFNKGYGKGCAIINPCKGTKNQNKKETYQHAKRL
jgi:hypothetical protein